MLSQMLLQAQENKLHPFMLNVFCVLLYCLSGFSMSTWEHEARLMTHLFGNNTFASLTRPNPNGGGALNVTIGLAYVQLMDLVCDPSSLQKDSPKHSLYVYICTTFLRLLATKKASLKSRQP